LEKFDDPLVLWYALFELIVPDYNPVVFISTIDDSDKVQKEQPDEKHGQFSHKQTNSASDTT